MGPGSQVDIGQLGSGQRSNCAWLFAAGWAVAGGSGKRALGAVSIAEAAAAHAANAGWVEDCAIHLLCVLALDRFGDFVSDQVREMGYW